jgi:hypothetical protein
VSHTLYENSRLFQEVKSRDLTFELVQDSAEIEDTFLKLSLVVMDSLRCRYKVNFFGFDPLLLRNQNV